MNKLTLIGRLGRNAEMTYTPTGTAVTKTSMAVSRKYTKNGEKVEETTWFNLTAFEKLGETMAQWCKKGDQLYVEGRVSARAYQDKQGAWQVSLDVTVDRIELLGNKRDEPVAVGATEAGTADGTDFPF